MVNYLKIRHGLFLRSMVVLTVLISSSLTLADVCTALNSELQARYPSYQQSIWMQEDGREISWSRVGPEGGSPVLYAHGNPGSRFELLFFEALAIKHNLVFYLIERPGFGCSSFVDGYQLSDYADDAHRFVSEYLKITTLDAFGWSSGGPPTLALGYYHPELINRLVISSSYSNFGELVSARDLMRSHHRRGPGLSEKAPHLFHGLLTLIGWASHKLPNVYFKVTESEVSDADKRILELPGIKPMFLLNQEAAFERGANGPTQDLEVQWQPWPFSLKGLGVPVLLLQGEEDRLVPAEFVHHLSQTIPDSSLWLLQGQGHLFPLDIDYQEKILEWLQLETKSSRKVTRE